MSVLSRIATCSHARQSRRAADEARLGGLKRGIVPAGTVETLAGRCGRLGLKDGSAEEARFSAEVWDVHCAPHDCSVLVADPGNGALRRITLDPETCPKPPGAARHKGAFHTPYLQSMLTRVLAMTSLTGLGLRAALQGPWPRTNCVLCAACQGGQE